MFTAIGVVCFDTRLGAQQVNLQPSTDAYKLIKAIVGAFDGLLQTTLYWPLHRNGKTKTWHKFREDLDMVWK